MCPKDLFVRFIRIVGIFNKLDSRPYEFSEAEKLFRSELHTLQAIGKGEGRTVTEFGNFFGTTKGAVSQIVSKLVAKGYLAKKRNPDCGKEFFLSLSASGKSVFNANEALHQRIDPELLASLEPVSAEEIHTGRCASVSPASGNRASTSGDCSPTQHTTCRSSPWSSSRGCSTVRPL
jgi:DNA-binding MarR family transcriptional regulator